MVQDKFIVYKAYCRKFSEKKGEIMKVLLISFTTNPDLQSYLYNLYEYLKNNNVECHTIGSKDVKVSVKLDVNNILLDTTEKPDISLNSIKLLMKNLGKIISVINNIKPDIIHFISSHTWNFLILLYLRLSGTSSKILHTIHDPVGHDREKVQKKVILYNKIVNWLLDSVVLHSYNSYEKYVNNYVPKKPAVIPLGEFKEKNFIEPRYTKKALIFGRLNAYKGLEYIPEIADQLYKLDKDIIISVYGKISEDIDEDLINCIRVKNNIELVDRFIGEKELEELLYEHDVVLITYTSISQSGVIALSMVNSKPIIAFNIEGMEEFVNSQCAVLIDDFNTSEFANAVYQLLNDNERLLTMSKEAWNLSKEKYTIERMGNELLNYYAKLCN